MVVIRLSRGGANKRPFFHIVAADKRAPNSGRFIEQVGYFNPIACGKEIRLHLEKERIQHWVSAGAQLTDCVKKLIRQMDTMPSQIGEDVLTTRTAKKSKKTKVKEATAKQAAIETAAAEAQAAETPEAEAKVAEPEAGAAEQTENK